MAALEEGLTKSYPDFLRDFSIFLLPSLTTSLLHVVAPGGLMGSPRAVILSVSLILCLIHSFLHNKVPLVTHYVTHDS